MHIYNQLLSAFTELCHGGAYVSAVKKAWQLVQDEAVQKLNVYANHMINGIVKDIELHAVVIDSEHIRYSNCTCQESTFCEHIGALFFYYCRSLENGRVLAQQAYFQMLGIVKAAAAECKEEGEQPVIHRNSNVEAILATMQQQFGEEWRKCKHSYHSLSQTLTALKRLAKHSEYEVQRLHWCASILFVLYLGERALQASDSFSRYYHEMSFKRISEPWSAQLYEIIEQLESEPLEPFQQSWLKQYIRFVYTRMEMYEKPMLEWDFMYYRLIALAAGKQPIEQELQKEIKAQMVHEQRPSLLHPNYGALAIFSFQSNEDEKALHYLQQCQFEKVQRLIYPMVEQRMQTGKWDEVAMWMDWLQEKFRSGNQLRSLGPFLTLCRKAMAQQPNNRQWLDTMLMLLPHSYQALTEHYLDNGQYIEWADLQMYMGRKIEELKNQELQKLEQHAPKVLLPLYHQTIEEAIHTRNRQGYRLAAKFMKRLLGLYEQLDQRHVWQVYYERMQNKYSRLRAFQEELVKGKLIE